MDYFGLNLPKSPGDWGSDLDLLASGGWGFAPSRSG